MIRTFFLTFISLHLLACSSVSNIQSEHPRPYGGLGSSLSKLNHFGYQQCYSIGCLFVPLGFVAGFTDITLSTAADTATLPYTLAHFPGFRPGFMKLVGNYSLSNNDCISKLELKEDGFGHFIIAQREWYERDRHTCYKNKAHCRMTRVSWNNLDGFVVLDSEGYTGVTLKVVSGSGDLLYLGHKTDSGYKKNICKGKVVLKKFVQQPLYRSAGEQ